MVSINDNSPIRLFLGYDSRLPLPYHVFLQSMMKHASRPISVTPLALNHLDKILTRKRMPDQLTDFTYSRFLIPYLCQYEGWAIFMDATDMLLRDDIAKLWDLRDSQYDVLLVKHPDIQGQHSFMNKSIESYKMFNWSSLMLFNNAACMTLSIDYVNTASYHDLHQFKWIEDHNKIGELPKRWNYLVGYHPPSKNISLVHWTQGAPHLEGSDDRVEYEEEWKQIKDELIYCS